MRAIMADRSDSLPGQSLSLAVIATVAAIALLQYGQELFAPMTLGLVTGVVLAPVMTKLSGIGVPRAVSATSALLLAVAGIVVGIGLVGPIVLDMVGQIPRLESRVFYWLEDITRTLRGLEPLTEEIKKSITGPGGSGMEDAVPTLSEALWMAPNFMAQALIFAGTLFFFLLTRDDIYLALPARSATLRRADRAVSHYFTTVTAINGVLGAAVFGAMTVLGMPNAVLWGVAAFILNFVLYLGPAVMLLSLFVAGMINMTGFQALLPPIAYLALNMTEAQFVTPTLVGQRLRMNPLVVFLAILFGLWLWGPMGGIVALPVIVWVGAYFSAGVEAATSPNIATPDRHGAIEADE